MSSCKLNGLCHFNGTFVNAVQPSADPLTAAQGVVPPAALLSELTRPGLSLSLPCSYAALFVASASHSVTHPPCQGHVPWLCACQSHVQYRQCVQFLQASQLPWREPSRGFNLNFDFSGLKGLSVDKIAEDFKVCLFGCCMHHCSYQHKCAFVDSLLPSHCARKADHLVSSAKQALQMQSCFGNIDLLAFQLKHRLDQQTLQLSGDTMKLLQPLCVCYVAHASGSMCNKVHETPLPRAV